MIEKLVLDRFRGATVRTQIPIEPQPLVVIYGPNGSGKSTLVDAIEVVCSGSAGSLAARSGVSVRDLPSLGSDPGDVRVELHGRGRIWGGELKTRSAELRDSSLPRVQILRRHQILALAEATPSEKFEQIKRFVDVSGVQRSEDALKKAADMAEDRRTRALDDRARAAEHLERLWFGEGKPGATGMNALSWARSIQDSAPAFALVNGLEPLIQALDSACAIKQAGREARETANRVQSELANLTAEIERDFGALSNPDASSIALLRQTLQYLDQPGEHPSCPVCRLATTASELRRSIEERLRPLSTLCELTDEITQKQEAVRSANERLQSYREQYDALATSIHRIVRDASGPLKDVLAKLIGNDISALGAEPAKLTQTMLAVRDQLVVERQRLQQSVGLPNALRIHLDQIEDAEKRTLKAQETAAKLREIHRVVLELRREYVQQRLDAVSDECDGYYRLLHPEESISLGAMKLDPNRKASLVQSAVVNGVGDCSPQAVLSDSHLDTMGFCLWLALAMRDCGPDSILIVDDALTSVDSAHGARIASLLQQISRQIGQVIVTTHDREWLACFTALGDGVGVIRLGAWSIDQGITVDSS